MRNPSGGFATDGESEADARTGQSGDLESAAIPIAPVIKQTLAPSSSDSPAIERSGPDLGTDVNVEAVIAASTRAEATLSALQQAIQQVTAGVSGAREANDLLAQELQSVREMLGASNEHRLMLKNQVTLFEQQLIEARADAVTEREYLIEEQDKFLMGLLEEHAEVVDRLVREREEAYARLEKLMRQMSEQPRRSTYPGLGKTSNPPDSGGGPQSSRTTDPGPDMDVEKLRAERDRSREVLRRLQVQRDEAQQALIQMTEERDRLLAELSKVAPDRVPPPTRRWSVQEGRRTQPAVPHNMARPTDPIPPDPQVPIVDAAAERVTAPPSSGASAAIAASRQVPDDPSAQPKPSIKRKPDPTLNPLGGYSVSGQEVATEKLDTPVRPQRR